MGILGQIRSLTIPDNAQLGARLFVTDGVNHNWVYDGLHDDPRPMGAEPQRDSLNATLSSGGSLEAGAIYTYGVRRVIKSGRLEIPGSTTTATVQTDDTNRTVTVELQDYQETIPDGAHWSVHYQVLRSLANATDTLYLVEELDQSGYDALSSGAYEDSSSDDSLDTSVSVPLDKIRNLRIPPVRFITSWQGMLLAGGSAAYSEGGVSGSAGSATVTVVGPGEVTEADRRANLWVAGEDRVFRITEVDTANAQYTLDADLAADHTEETEWQRWHDHDTVFITPPVPGDIEGYTLGEEIITQRDAGNKLTGLAAGSAGVYAFRESSVEFITGDKNGVGVMPHPYSPPGCASHATIASEHMPGVIYYAGHQGVWRISDSEAQKISRPVDPIIRGHVDHTVDKYTHGIYDPVSGLYFLWLFG